MKKNLKATVTTVTTAGMLLTSISPSFAAEQQEQPQKRFISTQEQQNKESNELTDAELKQDNIPSPRVSENVLENNFDTNSVERSIVSGTITSVQQILIGLKYLKYDIKYSRYIKGDYIKVYINGKDDGTKIFTGKDKFSSFITYNPVSKGDRILVYMFDSNHSVIGTAEDIASRDYGTVTETLPSAPEVNEVKDTDMKVTGNAKAGSTVKVKAGDQEIGTGKADEKGQYSIEIPAQPAGTKLTVMASNSAGTSEGTEVTVKETLPSAPEVNEVKDTDMKVTGNAKAG
ncbi:Ig-like domain-containing protein, partial [Bacillus cereus]|uniref:Ig-like domain-containing protein n=1 Tax=Bacillus cereus TaxID=1396 RepID=UPI0020D27C7E